MQIKPIRTKADYRATLKRIERLMHTEAGSPEGKRLSALARSVEAYERKHFPMGLPKAFESLRWPVRSHRETARLASSRANVRRLRAAHAEIEAEISRRKVLRAKNR